MTARPKSISAAATTITKGSLCRRGASAGASKPPIYARFAHFRGAYALSAQCCATSSSSEAKAPAESALTALQNLVKQAELALAGRIPAEFFGVAARGRPRRKRAE